MAIFSVLLLTAAPPGQSQDAGGATIKIDGREALLRSVELFLNRENIKQLQIVFDAGAIEDAKRKFGNHLGFSGVKVISSTTRWIDQVASAAEKIAAEATHVILHDAARPAVPFSDIDALLESAEKYSAVALTCPLRASLLELDEGGQPISSHLSSRFVQILTPQAMTREKYLEMAKSKHEIHPSQWTLVKGSSLNVRVGSGADAGLIKSLIGMLPKPKVKALSNPFEEAQW